MGFRDAKLVPLNGEGPEDVVVDADGQVYTGLSDGRILRVSQDGRTVETIAELDGRVYGLEFYGEDELLACGGPRGLLAVSISDGAARSLVSGADLRACNNAAVAADGTIYFSDSSTHFDPSQWRRSLLHQTGTGRLLRRTPDGEVEELLGGLHFANGVALAPDESFVVVAETGERRLTRYWLSGDAAGTSDVFADNLTGYPDNASTGSDQLIWVALASPRVRAFEVLRGTPKVVRDVVGRLPQRLRITSTVAAIGLDTSGKVVRQYRGRLEGFTVLSAVRERDGWLYFGSLLGNHVVVMPYLG